MTKKRRRLTGILLVVASLTVPFAGAAQAGQSGQGKPVVGSRSLGDPLLPQLGNGGYDARHYRIELDYDPATNRFDTARTMIRPGRPSTLASLQPRLPGRPEVSSVTVGRAPQRSSGSRTATPR